MNATLRAQSAYGAPTVATQTPRDIEFHAFAQITSAMSAARDSGDFPRLAAAMHENVRLWATLAIDAALPENPLPPLLRSRIVHLAAFARAHAARVLRREDSVDALIDVNTAVMKGLRHAPEAAA
jgi:flagellar protein FlaF